MVRGVEEEVVVRGAEEEEASEQVERRRRCTLFTFIVFVLTRLAPPFAASAIRSLAAAPHSARPNLSRYSSLYLLVSTPS